MQLIKRIKLRKELEQSLVRLVAGIVLVTYMLLIDYGNLRDAIFANQQFSLRSINTEILLSVSYLLVMLLMFVLLYVNWIKAKLARTLSLLIDISMLSYAMTAVPDVVLPFFFLYFWVIIGHAFRFGLPDLIRATSLAVLGFSLAIITGAYWHSHMVMASWYLISLLLIPAYIALFLKREKHYLEQLEQQKARATQANEDKSNFLVNVAHELRSPLNGMTTVGELLTATELNDKQREYAQVITTFSKVLLSLINNILDYSKIESNNIELDGRHFNLVEMVNSVTTILQPLAKRKNISLETRFSELLPKYVYGDPTKITQILMNITNNAIKFTERGYTLINVYPVSNIHDTLTIRFEVIDTGVGISEAAKARLMDSMNQTATAKGRRHGGTGLGIAITKKLVEHIGGKIGVSSEVGLGSRFWFELPLEVTAPAKNIAVEQNIIIFTQEANLIRQLKKTVEVWDYSLDGYADSEVIQYYTNPGVDKVPSAIIIDYPLAAQANEYISKIDPQVKSSINFILLSGNKLGDKKTIELYDTILPMPLNTRQLYHSLFFKSQKTDSVVTPITVASSFKRKLPKSVTGLKILICDDEPTNRYVLNELLETMGHIVTQCGSGFEVLDLLQESEFDMAIIDLQMPEMSGIEVAEIYQYSSPDNKVPLILASANIHSDVAEMSRNYFDAYIEKPIDYQKLLAIITKIIDEKIAKNQRIKQDLTRLQQIIVFDPSEFANYPKEAMEGEFLSSLFEIFVENASKNLAKIKSTIERQDLSGFKDQMHALRGIAGNVKAKRLEALTSRCQDIDQLSFAIKENTDYILETLQSCLNDTRQMLFAYLNEEFRTNQ